MHPIIFNSQSSWLKTHDHSKGLYTSSNSLLRCLYSPDKGDFSKRIAKILAVEKVTGRKFTGNGTSFSAKLAQASQQGENTQANFYSSTQEKQKKRKEKDSAGLQPLFPEGRYDAPGKGPSPQHRLSLFTLPSSAWLLGLWRKQHREQDCVVLLSSVIS